MTTAAPADKKPRTTGAPAKKPRAEAAKPAAQSGINHVLKVVQKHNCVELSRADGRPIGSFSTENVINEKFEEANDSRRIVRGKIVEKE